MESTIWSYVPKANVEALLVVLAVLQKNVKKCFRTKRADPLQDGKIQKPHHSAPSCRAPLFSFVVLAAGPLGAGRGDQVRHRKNRASNVQKY